MKLLKIADACLFEKRAPLPLSHVLSIRVPDGYALVLNDGEHFPSENGCVFLPAPRIKEGENTLCLVKGTEKLISEGLLRTGNLVTPMPLPTEALLFSLARAVAHLTAESQGHTEALSAIQAEKNRKRLFS